MYEYCEKVVKVGNKYCEKVKMFKRKIYNKLIEWKNESNGKRALLIEGARRIGKSTIVEEFARNEYESYILIDFSIAPKGVIELFDDISDLNYLFLQLQLQYKVDLIERESVIIFDEVQLCPKARQAIKSLVKDGRYDYIETGSLISIKKNVKDILIPSEEQRISMYPMDYEEFLWAIGDSSTFDILEKCYRSGTSLGHMTNSKELRQFKIYMLVGGMPQAVSTYIETNNFRLVDEIKRDIISLYESDFYKIDPTGKLSLMFSSIPSQLNKNAFKYQTTSILQTKDQERILELVSELKESKTVLLSYNCNDPNVGLSNTKDLTKFKMFLCDTGLFVTLMFKDRLFTDNTLYEHLLNDKLSVNLGYLYENAVAQCLAVKGEELYYHVIKNKKSRHYFEIDFIMSRMKKIIPIEVKSSGYNVHKSLDAFNEKFSDRILENYIIYTKDYAKIDNITYLPIYMTPFI